MLRPGPGLLSPWFYLCDHKKKMRKLGGKSNSILESPVCELQTKIITKGGSSRKVAASNPCGQFFVDSFPEKKS